MGLYNMLFGVNQTAPLLLAILGFKEADIPRFRDCYISNGQIVIYTRTGGGNRGYYESLESCRANYPEYFNGGDDEPKGPWNDDLRQSPYYVDDDDDDYDSTYAYFRFNYPPEYAEDLKALAERVKTYTPSEKWNALFDSFKKGNT